MSEEIRACRFCGGMAKLNGVGHFYVECHPCAFMGPDCDSKPQAIAAWNEANTSAPQREEGVVAWMDRSIWNVKGRRDVVVGDWSTHPDHLMRVRIIPEPEPEPEPRYAVERWGPKGAKVVDKHEFVHGRAFYDDHHPDPWDAAHAEADRLNKREREQQERGHE